MDKCATTSIISLCVCVCVYARALSSLTLWLHGLEPSRLLCPWNFPDKNTGMGYYFLLQGFSWPRVWTWVSCISCIGRQIPYQLHHLGNWLTIWQFLKKLNINLLHNSANLLLDIYLREVKMYSCKTLYINVHRQFICKETTMMSFNRWEDTDFSIQWRILQNRMFFNGTFFKTKK